MNEPDEVSPEALKVANGTLSTHGDDPVAALPRGEEVGQADDVTYGPTSVEKLGFRYVATLKEIGDRQNPWNNMLDALMKEIETSKHTSKLSTPKMINVQRNSSLSCSISIGGCPPWGLRRSRCKSNRSKVHCRCRRRSRLGSLGNILRRGRNSVELMIAIEVVGSCWDSSISHS